MSAFQFVSFSSAAATLRITDYGARGDAIRTTCTTRSNSTWITTSAAFSPADVGKLALL